MTRVREDDPELAPIKARCAETDKRICALHAELQNPMDETRKAELRKQYRKACEENAQADYDYRNFHYDRGDYSIPMPE